MEFSQPGYYFWINPNILIICTEISRVIQIEFWKFVIGCIVLPSTLASPFHIALVFLRVSVALLQGASQARGGDRGPGVRGPGADLGQR